MYFACVCMYADWDDEMIGYIDKHGPCCLGINIFCDHAMA